MSDIVWSDYQKNIFKFFGDSNGGNGCSVAVAGASKTTTAVEGMKYIPIQQRVLFSAFGRDIKADMESKTWMYPNVNVFTFNGLGWKACLNALRNRKPELIKDKTELILKKVIGYDGVDDKKNKLFFKIKGAIVRLISLFKGQLVGLNNIERMEELIDRFDIEFDMEKYGGILHDVYKECIECQTIMDYDDQVYQPVLNQWDVDRFHFGILDEGQDTNKMCFELILNALNWDGSKSNSRIMLIGDPMQSIYGFRGATPDVMKHISEMMNCKILPLSICYRCPKNVVKEAQKIVPYIEWWDKSSDGVVDSIGMDKMRNSGGVVGGDFVLCRCVDPLVSYILGEISVGRKAFINGRQIGEMLGTLVDSISGLEGSMDVGVFVNKLNEYRIRRSHELTKLGKDNLLEGLNDRLNSIASLCDGCSLVKDLLKRIDSVFPGEDEIKKNIGQYIQGMTIHKSKGLQNKRVFILRSDLLPHPSAKKDWMKEEEMRLKYVAITRSQGELFFVN